MSDSIDGLFLVGRRRHASDTPDGSLDGRTRHGSGSNIFHRNSGKFFKVVASKTVSRCYSNFENFFQAFMKINLHMKKPESSLGNYKGRIISIS